MAFANLSGADLTLASLAGAAMDSVSLKGAVTVGADFTGVTGENLPPEISAPAPPKQP